MSRPATPLFVMSLLSLCFAVAGAPKSASARQAQPQPSTKDQVLQDCPTYSQAVAEPDEVKKKALLQTAQACAKQKQQEAKRQAAAKKSNDKQIQKIGAMLESTGPLKDAGLSTPSGGSSLDVGAPAQQSVYATPDACSIKSQSVAHTNGQAFLSVHRELLREQDVKDDFGYRLGKRFLVYQVSVTNASKDFQYEIGDISIDLKDILLAQGAHFVDDTAARHQASSETLGMLRGVPEKGQDLDPRNLTLHVLQGIGAVGAGVSGLTPFSDTMGSAMANFNGAFIQALTGIAPDHTATQLNRLSDMAFSSNTLIGKLQTKTFAVFIPRSFVLTKDNSDNFRKNPRLLLNRLPLDQVNICVDGILLVQVATTADPEFSSDVDRVPPDTKISLTDSTANADIYYTNTGDTPTTASTKYSAALAGPHNWGDTLHIRAFATAANLAPSNVVDRTFTAAPQSPTPGLSGTPASVTISATAPNDAIYYSLDGTAPNTKSKLYKAGDTITLQTGQTLTAVEIGNETSFSDPATCAASAASCSPPPAAPAPAASAPASNH